MSFLRGNTFTISVTVTDATGRLIDPTTIVAQWSGADNVVHTPAVTRSSQGIYTFPIDSFLAPVAPYQDIIWRCYAPDGDPGQFADGDEFRLLSPGAFSP